MHGGNLTWGIVSGAGFGHIAQIIANGGGTSPGGTFFGDGFGHIRQMSTMGGATWPGQEEIFRYSIT